jgi:hypothetical protein
MSNNRRDFFKTLGTAAAGVAAINPLVNPGTASAATTAYRAAFLHALVLDETLAGILREVDGGDAVGIIAVQPVDPPSFVVRKHIANVKYEDIKITCGADMTPSFFGWISQLLNRNPVPRSGAIVSADAGGRTQSQLTFQHALLTEVIFPELDAAEKQIGRFALKLAPETTNVAQPGLPTLKGTTTAKEKQWLTSNFRVSIGTIPAEATSRVSKVDAIVIKQKLSEGEAGEIRDPILEVEPLDVGNITLTVPERFAQPFLDWHHNFVVEGNNSSESETFLKIEYLGVRNDVLFTLFFTGVGIYRASRLGETDKRANLRVVQVGLYAETAQFFVGVLPPS